MGWGGEGVSEKTVCSGLAFWDRKEFFFQVRWETPEKLMCFLSARVCEFIHCTCVIL